MGDCTDDCSGGFEYVLVSGTGCNGPKSRRVFGNGAAVRCRNLDICQRSYDGDYSHLVHHFGVGFLATLVARRFLSDQRRRPTQGYLELLLWRGQCVEHHPGSRSGIGSLQRNIAIRISPASSADWNTDSAPERDGVKVCFDQEAFASGKEVHFIPRCLQICWRIRVRWVPPPFNKSIASHIHCEIWAKLCAVCCQNSVIMGNHGFSAGLRAEQI